MLGQSLNLAIEVRLDSPDDATAQCFRVEVLHGDVPIDAARVRVLVQAQGASSQDAVIRVRSSAVVDEPVIGVVVQALCGQQGSRRYDFLPEFPPELVAAQAPVAVVPDVAALAPAAPAPEAAANGTGNTPMAAPARPPLATPQPAVQAPPPAGALPPAPAPARAREPAPARARAPAAAAQPAAPRAAARAPVAAARPAPRPAPRPAVAAKAPAPTATPAPAPAVTPAESAPGASASGPRLTLDAPTGQPTALRGSAALAAPPADNLAQRAEAAAAWRALNTGPEEAGRDAERLQALQAQEKAALDARRKAEADLLARLERAERRLDEAENNRVDIAIVYGMLALLLAALAAAAFFWSRSRKSAREAAHWAEEAAVEHRAMDSRMGVRSSTHLPTTGSPDSLLRSAPGDVWQPAAKAAAAAPVPAPPSAPRSLPIPFPVASAARAKGMGTDAALMRAANPEDFLDAQQHADFFVSLGQYDQAIEVLKKHIDDNAEMSPLAYLELMKIYHTLSRQADYNALRQEFHGHFNARVPNFAAFTDEGIGLDDYPATMLSIETAWGTPRVLDTIEANIFRTDGDSGKPLDLAAYRDLLMLYAVAKTLARTDEASTGDSAGKLFGPGGTPSDSAFMPQRLTRPDFTASLNSPDASFGRSGAAPLAAAAAAGATGAVSWAKVEPELDSAPAPLPRYDQELMLDLDLSNSLSLALDDAHAPSARPSAPGAALPPLPPLAEVDIDLPLLEMEIEPETGFQTNPAQLNETAPQPPAPVAPVKPEFDSSMIDFDLFDPNTEARIAPKSTR